MAYRFPFPPYPNGWFAIGFSSDFPRGEVVTRHYFGEDIVVYRTLDGALRASEPHCPHVGAHLGHGGRVVDDCLRCPFHGWRFDAAGQCVEIPGATRIPPKALLRTWPLREVNGVAFVHHHAGGAAPSWDVPQLPEEGWTADRTVLWNLRTHPQEVSENIVDSAHLAPLHGCERALVLRDAAEDGPSFNLALNLHADGAIVGMPGMINDVVLDVTLHGLGHMVVQTDVRNVGIRARQRIYCTPVDEERTEIRGVVNLLALDDPDTTAQVADLFYQAYVIDFAQDFPIWENKRYRDKPILSSADGPFMPYRKWARQFYSAAESV
jgi:phenylpropionate dioxygenase-like ring-hydroxylating dioxygenase large terminal subunit